MSRKFKLTIANAEWSGDSDAQHLYVPGLGHIGHAVFRDGSDGWEAFIGNNQSLGCRRSMRAAKAYVIKQLAGEKEK